MIQILGLKRVLTLVVLLVTNIVLAGLLYLVVVPGADATQNDLRTTRNAIQSRRAEIHRLQTQYTEIQKQKNQFGELEKAGFFTQQDRVKARDIIAAIQAKSHVLSAKYNIKAVEVEKNPIAAQSKHVLMQSPVSMSVDALDDIDIYRFVYWLENAFPGHTTLTSLSIERGKDLDEEALKQIGNGVPVVLVSAKLNFAWDTFVAEKDLPPQLAAQMKP